MPCYHTKNDVFLWSSAYSKNALRTPVCLNIELKVTVYLCESRVVALKLFLPWSTSEAGKKFTSPTIQSLRNCEQWEAKINSNETKVSTVAFCYLVSQHYITIIITKFLSPGFSQLLCRQNLIQAIISLTFKGMFRNLLLIYRSCYCTHTQTHTHSDGIQQPQAWHWLHHQEKPMFNISLKDRKAKPALVVLMPF